VLPPLGSPPTPGGRTGSTPVAQAPSATAATAATAATPASSAFIHRPSPLLVLMTSPPDLVSTGRRPSSPPARRARRAVRGGDPEIVRPWTGGSSRTIDGSIAFPG
jgi:hypothetical protein